MKKRLLIFLLAIMIVGVFFTILFLTKKEKNTENNQSPIATIIQSKYEGMDYGTEYVYTIFQSSKTGYSYQKETVEITIAGPGVIKTQTGKIRNKQEFNKVIKLKKGFDEFIYTDSNKQLTRKELMKILF